MSHIPIQTLLKYHYSIYIHVSFDFTVTQQDRLVRLTCSLTSLTAWLWCLFEMFWRDWTTSQRRRNDNRFIDTDEDTNSQLPSIPNVQSNMYPSLHAAHPNQTVHHYTTLYMYVKNNLHKGSPACSPLSRGYKVNTHSNFYYTNSSH